MEKPECKARIAELEEKFKGKKIIVGVDRLDYIKGVPQKLHAFEVFLTKHPEWRGKVPPSSPRTLPLLLSLVAGGLMMSGGVGPSCCAFAGRCGGVSKSPDDGE
jgi:Glycosyltransferase family 20